MQETIQNSEDAKAKETCFILDERKYQNRSLFETVQGKKTLDSLQVMLANILVRPYFCSIPRDQPCMCTMMLSSPRQTGRESSAPPWGVIKVTIQRRSASLALGSALSTISQVQRT